MKKLIIFLPAAILLCTCAPSTRLTGSWKNPKLEGQNYQRIFVAALTGNTIAKSSIEKEMEASLRKQGISVTKSMDEFPPGLGKDTIPKDVIMKSVRKNNDQAILTISILKRQTESRYVGGGYTPMTRFGYYGNFWGYYNYWYPYAYNPGYYVNDEVYYLETNLYDSGDEALVWSAQSETYNYNGLNVFAKEYANVIVEQLIKEGILIQPKSK